MKFLHSPLSVAMFLVAGVLVGVYAPGFARSLAPFSKLYIDLLKMIVLPLIVSSIIFSLRSLIHDPKAGSYIIKVAAAVVLVSAAAVAVAMALTLLMRPGEISDPAIRAAFGQIVSRDTVSTELQMNLHEIAAPGSQSRLIDTLLSVVPSNIFQALATGDTVKVLVFALLFGFAIGRVPVAVSDPLAHSLDTVYRACIILTRWFNLMLPFATFAMIADQTAIVGFRTLRLMVDFLGVIGLATALLVAVSIVVVALRTRRTPWAVLRAHQDVAVMAIATRSSVACIPAMIDTLTERLGLRRDVVELLVPLQTAIVRAGPIMLFVVGPLFVAQLYGRVLDGSDLVFLAVVSVLLGLTTAGMSGITVLTQVGIVCGYLGLPFEAAFVLFVAVDAVTDTLRTVTLVFTIDAATASIAPLDPDAHTYAVEEALPLEPAAPRA
ncbi:dicarboxylate/amino acid:cation symporter [Rhodoplanes roseus]|uniref:dicarboxylate/amino acid:cation symporter n=1 Tax=Rhodoplanes roseus TaxID=29409 RepID=UPI00147421D9|nr:cation:dicarboxylase symporter family transporter [Rhodoplanes roseus]